MHRSSGRVLSAARRAGFALALCLPAGVSSAGSPQLRDGDIIFHTSRSSQSRAIQRATGSRYSHMGLILHRGGQPYVLEAVATVRYTPLAAWVARGAGRHFVVKRLRDAPEVWTPAAVKNLHASARSFVGRSYDLVFEWSDERMYCSELVWKLCERTVGIRLGELQRLRDFNLSHAKVQAKMRERYGGRPPLDEPVISPAAMFESPLLATVVEQ